MYSGIQQKLCCKRRITSSICNVDLLFSSAKPPCLRARQGDRLSTGSGKALQKGGEGVFQCYSLLLTHLFHILSLITQGCSWISCVYKGCSTEEEGGTHE